MRVQMISFPLGVAICHACRPSRTLECSWVGGAVRGSVKKLQRETANGEWQSQRLERDPHKGKKGGGMTAEKAKKGNVNSGKAQLEKNGKHWESERRKGACFGMQSANSLKCLHWPQVSKKPLFPGLMRPRKVAIFHLNISHWQYVEKETRKYSLRNKILL